MIREDLKLPIAGVTSNQGPYSHNLNDSFLRNTHQTTLISYIFSLRRASNKSPLQKIAQKLPPINNPSRNQANPQIPRYTRSSRPAEREDKCLMPQHSALIDTAARGYFHPRIFIAPAPAASHSILISLISSWRGWLRAGKPAESGKEERESPFIIQTASN